MMSNPQDFGHSTPDSIASHRTTIPKITTSKQPNEFWKQLSLFPYDLCDDLFLSKDHLTCKQQLCKNL